MDFRRTPAAWITLLMLLSLFGSAIGGMVGNVFAKQTSTFANHAVISEFRTQGPQGGNDEFIEIFNPTSASIDISSWEIWVSNNTGGIALLYVLPSSQSLLPGQHFLIANTSTNGYSEGTTFDGSYSLTGINDTGGIALRLPSAGTIVDQVGMDAGSSYKEGTPLLPLSANPNPQSYERGAPGASLNGCYDSDNNQADFYLQNPMPAGSPQNLNNALTQCSINPPVATHVVISEFRSRGPGGDEDEFIELYNPTGATIDISGWSVRVSASCSTETSLLFTIASGTVLQAGQHFLAVSNTITPAIPGADQSFSPDLDDEGGIALDNGSGSFVDQAGMCLTTQYREGTPLDPLIGLSDQSYERLPGGETACTDSDVNKADFRLLDPADPQGMAKPRVLCAGVSTATPTTSPTTTSTSTSTPTSTPKPPLHLVISEFRARGPKGLNDEFVELYNATGGAVNIGGWVIKRSSGCGSTVNTLVTIDSGVILQAGQHYLLASNQDSSISGADKTFAPGIANTGGVALFTSATSTSAVDQVGLCEDTEFREGIPLASLLEDLNQGYERNVGGATSCHDTDNNSADFHLLNPSNPQNKASPIAVCSGAVTATFTPTITATRTITRTPTRTITPTRTSTPVPTSYPGKIALNEVLPRPVSDWNADGEINSRDEYIEIINMGYDPINIQGWKLDDGPGGSDPYTLPGLVLQSRQILRFFALETGIFLSDAGDTARLIKPDGSTADIWNYPVVTAADRTWCRLPDGNGAWGFVCRPTPGRPNANVNSEGTQDEKPPRVETDVCLLPDTIPLAFWLGECGAPGGEIWNRFASQEFWLQSRWKWDVYMK